MNKIIRRSGLIIPKKHKEFSSIESDLYRQVIGWQDQLETYCFYERLDNGDLLIPRFYPVKDKDIIDQCNIGLDINIVSKIKLRNERQKLSVQHLVETNSSILQLEPGSGKTVCTIQSICEYKKKTIIFVHKHKSNFLNCLDKAEYGYAIFDEAHAVTGPGAFSISALYTNVKKIHGLSATPIRNENEDIMKYHLGEVKYFEAGSSELLSPVIYMIHMGHGVLLKKSKYVFWGGRISYDKYYKGLIKSTRFIEQATQAIRKLYDAGRNVLILGDRVALLMNIAETLELPKSDIGIFIPKINGISSKVEERIGKIKQLPASKERNKKIKELNEMLALRKQALRVSDTEDMNVAFHQKRLVFGTYLGARDGLSRENFDAIVLLTACSNVEQAIGRILRIHPGKPKPIAIDFVDTEGPKFFSKDLQKPVPYFVRSSVKRKLVYDEKKWEVKKIEIV